MRYWTKLHNIQSVRSEDWSRDPQDLKVWVDYSFTQAQESEVLATLVKVTGIADAFLNDVQHPAAFGTVCINVANHSHRPWEELLPEILSVIRETLVLQEELEEISVAPWHASE